MRNESEIQFPMLAYRPGDAPPSRPTRRHALVRTFAGAMAAFVLLCGVAASQDGSGHR